MISFVPYINVNKIFRFSSSIEVNIIFWEKLPVNWNAEVHLDSRKLFIPKTTSFLLDLQLFC